LCEYLPPASVPQHEGDRAFYASDHLRTDTRRAARQEWCSLVAVGLAQVERPAKAKSIDYDQFKRTAESKKGTAQLSESGHGHVRHRLLAPRGILARGIGAWNGFVVQRHAAIALTIPHVACAPQFR
jgi:hypothetical protein